MDENKKLQEELHELFELKQKWWCEAKDKRSIQACENVVDSLGEDHQEGHYDDWCRCWTQGDLSIRKTLSYHPILTVHYQGKKMCSTKEEEDLFVPGPWMDKVRAALPEAELANKQKEKNERLKMIRSMKIELGLLQETDETTEEKKETVKEIPNLWPKNITEEELAPFEILLAQTNFFNSMMDSLGKPLPNRPEVKVVISDKSGLAKPLMINLYLDLYSPKHKHSFTLLRLQQHTDMYYPIEIKETYGVFRNESKPSWPKINSAIDLMTFIKHLLDSADVRSLVGHIARESGN